MKKKKKNKKFQNMNINIEYKPKRIFSIQTTVKNVSPDYIITLPKISYLILSQKNTNTHNNSTSFTFSIYNITNFELIQKIITSDNLSHCFILDENKIILSGRQNISEIWQKENKDKINKFSKYKSLDFSINSFILYDSKSFLFFHHYYDYMKSSLEIWDTENKIPKSLIIKNNICSSYEKKIFFINNEKTLVVYHYPFLEKHFHNISISFYDITCMKNIKNIKNIELDNNYCDLKPFKLDEKRIIIIEKISEDNSYDENVKQNIQIMKVPEFEIVKEIEVEFFVSDVVVYKKYFILYEAMIKIYNIDNYEILKEINIQGIYKLVHLKENFFIGIVNQYYQTIFNLIPDYYEEKNQKKDLIMYEVNL